MAQNNLCGDIINILIDFLSNRQQRVILNSQCSLWADIHSVAPQGSVLGPLLFLIDINDLSVGLKNECKLFAGNISL